MNYVKSKDIQVFPSSIRGQYTNGGTKFVFNPGSRLTSEYNLTTFASMASSHHKSFVIDYDNNKLITFRLMGYLFSIDMTDYLNLNAFTDKIYAIIKLENVATESENNPNTVDTRPVLKSLNEDSPTTLDAGTIDGEFYGLSLQANEPATNGLFLLEKVDGEWKVPDSSYFKMSIDEISNVDRLKPISEELDTNLLNVSKINGLTIDTTTGTLDIANAKTLTVNGSVTLAGTGTATFNKNLTVSNNDITLDADATRTLKISGANKEIAGVGTKLTLANSLNLAGTTGAITLGNSAHTVGLTTTANTSVTLPTIGTLSTLSGNETLENKTLTLPKIKDSDLSHTYNITVSNLTADRTITLPLLTGNDAFVFEKHAQTLTNKTLTSPTLTQPTLGVATATSINGLKINTTTGTLDVADNKSLTEHVDLTVGAPTVNTGAVTIMSAGAGATIIKGPSGGTTTLVNGTMVGTTNEQTLTNKTLTSSIINGGQVNNLTTLSLKDGANALTLESDSTLSADKKLTFKTGNVDRTLTFTGSPSLSGIKTTGTGILAMTSNATFATPLTVITGAVTLVGNSSDSSGSTLTLPSVLTLPASVTGGVVYGNSNTEYAITSAGTAGQVLMSNGVNAPTWSNESTTFTAKQATQLTEYKTLWGQPFNGTDNVTGSLKSVGSISRSASAGTYNIGTSVSPFTNIYAHNIYASSDERLKENIVDYKYHDSILDISVKEFDYKDSKTHTIGFIAQELQEKFPELVTKEKDEYLSIQESKLVYLLLEEVKKLKKEVEQLKAERR